jgi:hypothetical protein
MEVRPSVLQAALLAPAACRNAFPPGTKKEPAYLNGFRPVVSPMPKCVCQTENFAVLVPATREHTQNNRRPRTNIIGPVQKTGLPVLSQRAGYRGA